jgi:hypothetical protein
MIYTKPFEELTLEDKIILLNFLFPNETRAFLEFTKMTLAWMLEEPEERLIPYCPKIGGPDLIEVTQVLWEHIISGCDQLAENKDVFLITFLKGINRYIFLLCIRFYRFEAHNPDYQNAIAFFFPY